MTALAIAELRRRAEEYAAALKPGDEVHDFDQEHIEQFRHLLPAALARRGMRLTTNGCGAVCNYDRCCRGCTREDVQHTHHQCAGHGGKPRVWTVHCDHEAISSMDQAAFREATVIVGFQADGDGGFLELGTHLPCGSTLAIPATTATKADAVSVNQGEQL